MLKFSLYSTLIIILSIHILAFSTSRNPESQMTGAPGESLCSQSGCHTGVGINRGAGFLSVNGFPDIYEPGKAYPITISVQHKGQKSWGFQATFLDEQEAGIGEIEKYNQDYLQIGKATVNGKGRFYISHTGDGTYTGQTDGPVQWEFTWKAPEKKSGIITAYIIGVAGDGENNPSDDFVYQRIRQLFPDKETLESNISDT